MSGNAELDRMLGDPRKAILSMVLPFLIAASVVQINQFVDTFWVSGLGSVASSAISTIIPVYGLIVCAGIGIGVAATATIAFRLGQGDRARASSLAGQSLTAGILCGIAGSLIAFLLFDAVIDLLGAQDVRRECFDYLLPFLFMSPVIISGMVLGGILRGEGAARRSTIVQMSARTSMVYLLF